MGAVVPRAGAARSLYCTMPVRERFPTFEDIVASRPDDLGAEIVLDLQVRPKQFFSPSNFPGDLARHYKGEAATEKFASAVWEAIEWASRAAIACSAIWLDAAFGCVDAVSPWSGIHPRRH